MRGACSDEAGWRHDRAQSHQGSVEGEKCFPQEGCRKRVGGLPRGASKGLSPQSSRTGLCLTGETGLPLPPSSPIPFPSAMLTMGVLGSPSNCRGAHRKGSVEPPAALALGKVQFLAS